MGVRLFQDSFALQSLRDSDFDTDSAYGEVIDNSLQANANRISINFETTTPKNNYSAISTLAFGDDGEGMDQDTLHRCLSYGYSSRYNDRSGIGRFGVGMIMGALHEVKQIEVFSKQKGGEWFYTRLNLDEIIASETAAIPEPFASTIPDQYKNLVGKDHGTLVLWSEYDRQPKSADLIIEDAKIYIGRTFRYFIWEGIEILVNNMAVNAHDPLYVRTEKTKFPSDPSAEAYPPIPIEWEIPTSERENASKTTSSIIINMSLLPEEFRPYQGAGGSKDNAERQIPANTGISILRNKREVFYGNIPRWQNKSNPWKFEEIDRWWGCEIHFSAEIDSQFTVKNIKRGADPVRALKDHIKALISPTQRTVLEKVRELWALNAQKKLSINTDAGIEHPVVEKIIKDSPATPKSKRGAENDPQDVAGTFLPTDLEPGKKQSAIDRFKAQPFTIIEENWPGHTVFDTEFAGANTIIKYNLNSEFFKTVYQRIESIKDEKSRTSSDLKDLLDLFIAALIITQAKYDDEIEIPNWGEFSSNLNGEMGMLLNNYVKAWSRETKLED